MIDGQFEFLISQYADGSLPVSERAALEARIASDAEARALLDEYRALDDSLKASMTLPAVNWDRLADHLSDTVAGTVADHRETRAATVLGRIGPSGTRWGKLALAACVVLAVGGVALWTQVKGGAGSGNGQVVSAPPNDRPPAAKPIVVVRGPAPQAPASNPVVFISVGPSSTVADNWRAAEGVVTGPSRAIWIASSDEGAQDTQRLPY